MTNLGMSPQDDRRNTLAAFIMLVTIVVCGGWYSYQRFGGYVSDMLDDALFLNEQTLPVPTGKQVLPSGDSDEDGLDASMEAMLGSSDTQMDTDGDGYSDYEEFLATYDAAQVDVSFTDVLLRARLQEFLLAYDWPYAVDVEAWYWLQLGQAWDDEGDAQKAAANYERSIAVDPTIDAFWNAYYAYADEKQYSKAQSIVDRYIDAFPWDWGAYYQRGNLAQRQEQFDTVAADYDKALSLGAEYTWLYNNYGALLSNEGNLEQALAMYLKAIDVEPDHPIIQENLALTYRDLGNEAEALKHEQIAKELRQQGIEM